MRHPHAPSKLGLGACISIASGGMIGSAIFSLSGLTISQAGASAVLSWTIAALIMLLYGLITAELASLFPKSGGVFVFPAKALGKNKSTGRFWGWISFWGYINSNIAAIAFSAIYMSIVLETIFPPLSEYQAMIALGSIAVATIFNILSAPAAGRVNNLLVGALIIALLIFVAMSLFGSDWSLKRMVPFFSQGSAGSFGFISAIPTAMLGYGAVVSIAFLAFDVSRPRKNIPKAIVISTLIVAAIYALVIVSIVGLLPAGLFAQHPDWRTAPFAAVCSVKLSEYPWVSVVVAAASALALFTTMLVLIAATSRTIQATARSGLFPKAFGKTKKDGVPVYAVLMVVCFSSFVSCFSQYAEQIVNLGALFSIITIGVNCFSLISARKKFAPPGRRQSKLRLYALPIGVFAVLVACYIPVVLEGGWSVWAYTLLWYAIGLAIYFWRSKFNRFKRSQPSNTPHTNRRQ